MILALCPKYGQGGFVLYAFCTWDQEFVLGTVVKPESRPTRFEMTLATVGSARKFACILLYRPCGPDHVSLDMSFAKKRKKDRERERRRGRKK